MRKLFYGYWIVVFGFVTLAVNNGLSFYGFAVLNKPVADELGWSRSAVTAGFSAYIIGAAVSSLISGKIADRYGPRLTMALGIAVNSLSFFLLSGTETVAGFWALYFITGIGLPLLGPIPVGVVITRWFHRLRGTMQGLAFTGIGVGGLVFAPLIGNGLVPRFGWRTTYLIMAFLLLAIMIPLVWFGFRNRPEDKGLRPFGWAGADGAAASGFSAGPAGDFDLRHALGTGTFWIIALTFAVYGMAFNAGFQNQVSILTGHGFHAADAVGAIGLIGLCSAFGKFFFGYFCDRVNPKYGAGLSYALVGLSLICMSQARTPLLLWVYAGLMGLGQGAWAPISAMLALSYFGARHYGAIVGAIHLIFMLGESVGPLAAGFAFDYTGSYRQVLLALAVICLFSVPVIVMIRKPWITTRQGSLVKQPG